MNKFLLFLGAALTFSWAVYSINYRPYISTRMAQVLMSPDIPDDEVTKRCDGSGWITHGDGHKTECPGCSACENNPKPEPDKPDVTYKCKCDTNRTYCNCKATYGQCSCKKTEVKKKEVESSNLYLDPSQDKPKYEIYHFGAKWCGPCEQMKKETWPNIEVQAIMNERGGKLHLLDADNSNHDKFFDWYEIGLYPTIIIMPVDDLEHPIFRVSGYVGPEDMKKTLEEKLKDE